MINLNLKKKLKLSSFILFLFITVNCYAATEFVCTINKTGEDYNTLTLWEAAMDDCGDITISATQVFSHGGITGTVGDASTVTGATSGKKAEVAHTTASQILLHDIRTVLTGTLTFPKGNASGWIASTAYSVGNYVEPTTANDFTYECTTAGTSDASEPAWDTTDGGTTNDGTVVWTTHSLKKVTGSGTDFNPEISIDDYIRLDADNSWVAVTTIVSDTEITLTSAYTLAGGAGSGANRKGAFSNGEQVQVDVSNYVTISDAGDSAVIVAECYDDDGALTISSAFTIDGLTTGLNNRIKIRVPEGERHNGTIRDGASGNGFLIIDTVWGNSECIRAGDNYIDFEWLSITIDKDSYAGGGAIAFLTNSIGGSIKNCVINSVGNVDASIVSASIGYTVDGGIYIQNNILYGGNRGIQSSGGLNLHIDNNTIYDCSGYGVYIWGWVENTTAIIKNTISVGNVDDWYYTEAGNFAAGTDYNLDEDGDANIGANSIQTTQNLTTEFFVSATDLHLRSTSDAVNAGSDLGTTNGVNIDIDGVARSGTWDIGADEYVSAGGRRRIIMVN